MIASRLVNRLQDNTLVLAMVVSAAALLHAATLIGRMLETPAPAAPVVSADIRDSLYGLDIALGTHRDAATTLGAGRGAPRLVTMFYSRCPHACPAMIESLRGIERELTAKERRRLGVLMVSFDPARDTTRELAALATQRRVHSERWTLAHTSPSNTASLAERLGVRYRALADGSFDHSSRIVLLDAEGRIVASTDRLGAPDPQFVAAVRRALAGERA